MTQWLDNFNLDFSTLSTTLVTPVMVYKCILMVNLTRSMKKFIMCIFEWFNKTVEHAIVIHLRLS